jgi:hypothetical protein
LDQAYLTIEETDSILRALKVQQEEYEKIY